MSVSSSRPHILTSCRIRELVFILHKRLHTQLHKHHAAVMLKTMSNCQTTHSTRFAQHVGIITPNPTTNPHPKTLTLIITVTKEINIK